MRGISTKFESATRKLARTTLAAVVVTGALLATAAPSFAADATAPDAPAQPTVTTAAGFVSVSFSAPADGGSAITAYAATCDSNDGGTSGSNTGTDSPISVGPIDVAKTYTCAVVATNAVGDSAPSIASDPIVVEAAVPDQPNQPIATPNDTSISLALDAPNDNGSPITSYDAVCTSSDGGVQGTATSDSLPIVVSSLSLGNTYNCTVTATNAIGTSLASPGSDDALIDPIAPGAPAQPSVLPGDGSITVSFSAPADGGSPISQYSVDCTSSDGGTEGTATDVASPIVVSGLDNGNTYTCTVTATNGAGTGAASDSSEPTVAGVPTIVGGALVTPADNAALVTYGDSAYDAGNAITSFTATCTSSDGGDPGTATGEAVPVTVTGLTNGATYTCTLSATNGRGDGPESAESDAFSPATIPGTPDAPSVTPGDQKLTVAFTAPSDSGDPIVSYDVECDSSDGGTTGTATDSASPIVVAGLDNGSTYSCIVRATNSTGTGLWSVPSSDVVVGPGAPDAPEITDLARSANSVTIGFTTPDGHDSPISAYTVTCSSDDGGTTQTATSDSSPIEVDGLTNSAYYTCTVDATNAVGTSDESSASDQFLAAAAPDAPHIAHMQLGNNSVAITVVAPADNGEAITTYEATCTSSNGGDTIVSDDPSTTIEVDGLTNGSTYTCAVTATNVMGTSAPTPDSASFVAGQVPDAPVVTGVTRGVNVVTVAFTVPWDGSIAIRSYTATCTSSDGGTTRTNQGSSSPITVGYLTNGFTYTCTVHAINSIGNSAESDPSDAFVAAATPRPPVITGAILGGSSVSVAFRSTGDGADAVTGYTVTCVSSNGGTLQHATDVASPIVVTSLTFLKTYSCTVVATNALGPSAASAASTVFVAATVPSAPTVSGITRGINSASVAFTTPANNGSAITSYTATCTSSDGGTTHSTAGTKSPLAVSSLTNANTYTCTVRAKNAVGTGSDSAASSPFVAATTPGQPAVNTVTRSSGAVSVDFTTPASGGAAIVSYKVACTSTNGGTIRTATGASSPILVTTLTSAKTYRCTVAAVNAVGTGTTSAASVPFVAAAVPAAPKIASLTRGTNSVSIAFPAPANNGDPITGYTATCASTNGGLTGTASGSSSPLVVSSLTNAKTYSCTVRAANTMGDSASSAASAFVAAAAPDAPTITSVSAAKGTATIVFTVPNANGAAITRYTATCTSSDGGTTRTGTNTRSPLSVTGLTIGKTYTCQLTATNALGTSSPTVPSATFVA
jgi:titin